MRDAHDVRDGSFASVEQCSSYVGLAPDSGRIAAPRRTDASGQEPPLLGIDLGQHPKLPG
jgi:hypothetical protein